jgi:methionine aminopeptidase
VHIDGYIASAGHTVILHEKEGEAITGDVANAVCAAYFASELVIRKMKAGMTVNSIRAQCMKRYTMLNGAKTKNTHSRTICPA